jgi:purine-binding chemotaxis protein CheW
MASTSYLVFSLQGSFYAIETLAVREILWLPELTPVREVPQHIVGVMNMRGEVVPVMDPAIPFGRMREPYRVTDKVIVLQWAGIRMGMIVNEVHDVRSIAAEATEPPPTCGAEDDGGMRFVTALAKVDQLVIMLLDMEKLIHFPAMPGTGEEGFCPDATPEERAVFQERARTLMQSIDSEDYVGLRPLAVVGLNHEYYGMDLDEVRGFSEPRSVAPVPCCPRHILGLMNIRGDILTLVDIRELLNMPIPDSAGSAKVVIIHTGKTPVGVAVDEVLDVIYLNPSLVTAAPAAVQSISEEYLKGMAPYGGKMLGILDLPRILDEGSLTVNEEA